MRVLIISLLFCLFGAFNIQASTPIASLNDSTSLPKVFILGEHEAAYQQLYADHSTVLLEVCKDDVDVAFDKWLGMLEAMEAYAKEIDYDIKGIKVWLNVFWDDDGKINHIAYHLKVNSRNVPREELTAFFSSFMNHYTFPMIYDKKYSHYGSAAFPTFAKKLKGNRVNDSASSKSKKKSNSASSGQGSY